MTGEAGMIARLVALHGEEGVCPTAADWRAIFAVAADGPVQILNLLRFHDRVAAAEGEITGAEAYARYGAGVAGAFARAGGKRLFRGAVGHAFGSHEDTDRDAGWDAVVVTAYPSAAALAGMWLDPDFVAAHRNRADGVARSRVLVFPGPPTPPAG